jgi:hypothetical protein
MEALMEAESNKPIRLTEGQTELLTRALTEAVEQGAIPTAGDTQTIKKPVVKAAPSTATASYKRTFI